jgi:hypothetical protein
MEELGGEFVAPMKLTPVLEKPGHDNPGVFTDIRGRQNTTAAQFAVSSTEELTVLFYRPLNVLSNQFR